jgi:hypothetical protein
MTKIISFKEFTKKLISINEISESWLDHNENEHLGKTNDEISNKLKQKQPELSKTEKEHITHYSSHSDDSNHYLMDTHKTKEPIKYDAVKDRIKHLKNATSHPIGHQVHLYSGLNFNPYEHMDKKTKILHLPAFTSTSHDKTVARNFAMEKYWTEKGPKHILHIHMKPTDKGVHINHETNFDKEHETILPNNTKLKVNPIHTTHIDRSGEYHIWHATVHSQE